MEVVAFVVALATVCAVPEAIKMHRKTVEIKKKLDAVRNSIGGQIYARAGH